METKFKTNIKCSACVAKVTPGLNEVAGENNWNVDLASPARILTVSTPIPESTISDALKKVGYSAEQIK